VKVGDTVAWVDVPSGALVRSSHGSIYVRVGDRGWVVGDSTIGVTCMFGRYCDDDDDAPWLWGRGEFSLTILALGLTGSETKETLSMLVRHFEESAATRQ